MGRLKARIVLFEVSLEGGFLARLITGVRLERDRFLSVFLFLAEQPAMFELEFELGREGLVDHGIDNLSV